MVLFGKCSRKIPSDHHPHIIVAILNGRYLSELSTVKLLVQLRPE